MLRDGADRPAVAHVDYVDVVVDHHDYDGARASLVMRLVRRGASYSQKVLFCHVRASPNGFRDIRRELWLQDDVVVEVVFEVLGALAAPVPVVDAEDLQLGPLLGGDTRHFLRGLDHVEDDRDPVLVCLAHDADVSIRCEGFHRAKGLRAHLTCLEEG